MLHLNSIQNAAVSPTGKNYIICHLTRIPKLAPSKSLFVQWQSNTINWEEFCERFKAEMRAEYLNPESQLRKLTDYSLKNDITLHSPEPRGDQTYRAILEEIINNIWEREGRIDRVINLAREPVEESQPAVAQELIEQNQRLVEQNGELNRINGQLREQINTHEAIIDDLRQTLLEKDRELKGQINAYETTIDDLRRTLSEKDGEIQSLNDAIGERDSENDRLNRTSGQLQQQIDNSETTIGDLRRTLSEKDGKIQSLNDAIGKRDRDSKELETQIVQLQDINTHPGIGDIAVRATEGNQAWSAYFRNLAINENLPITLRKWLEARLKQALSISLNHKPELSSLIQKYTNFDVDYSTEPDEFDKVDNYLAHVIRTQGNLIAHEEEEEEIYEKMIMGRALCCYFAAALLSSKLPEPKQPAFR